MKIYKILLTIVVTSRPLLLAVILGFLSACASIYNRDGELQWDQNLPDSQYFTEYFYASGRAQDIEQHMRWVKRFYYGITGLATGWLEMSQKLIDSTTNRSDKNYIEQKLISLGIDVCNEWARSNRLRNISTVNLAIWGDVLRESAKRGEQRQKLDQISDDIYRLIDRKLTSKSIDYQRYYQCQDYDNF